MPHQKIAVIGGTGKSGQYLVQELLHRGYHLHLLHRHPESLPPYPATVHVIKGDARDEDAIHRLLQGCTAVISTLGQPINEPSIFSQATGHVLRAMAQIGIRRYIVTAGLNVDSPLDHKSDWVREATAWMYAHYPKTTADRQIEYQLLLDSAQDWTLVRLPMILLSEEQKGIRLSLEDCPGKEIHGADLACFLIDQLNDRQYYRAAPFIASI